MDKTEEDKDERGWRGSSRYVHDPDRRVSWRVYLANVTFMVEAEMLLWKAAEHRERSGSNTAYSVSDYHFARRHCDPGGPNSENARCHNVVSTSMSDGAAYTRRR